MSAKATGFILLAVCLIIIYIANAPDQKSRPPKTVETVAAKDVAPADYLPLPEPKRRWVYEREISPLDDSVNILAYLKANEQNGPYIFIQCNEKSKNTYFSLIYGKAIDTAGSVNGTHTTYLIWRFDGGEAQESRWVLADNWKSVSPLGRDKGAVKWANWITKSNHVFVRAKGSSGYNIDSTFDLTGAEKALQPLRRACDWDSKLLAEGG